MLGAKSAIDICKIIWELKLQISFSKRIVWCKSINSLGLLQNQFGQLIESCFLDYGSWWNSAEIRPNLYYLLFINLAWGWKITTCNCTTKTNRRIIYCFFVCHTSQINDSWLSLSFMWHVSSEYNLVQYQLVVAVFCMSLLASSDHMSSV